MKMDEHARAWAHEFVASILGRSALAAEQRNSLHWEIVSHLHEAAERRTIARGGDIIMLQDLQATAQELGGPDGLAAAFLDNRVAATPRAALPRRFGAYVIDLVLAAFAYTALGVFLEVLFPFGYPFGLVFVEDLLFMGFLVACLVYLAVMEARFGQTVGKMVFQLRTVRVDGRPVGQQEAFVRNIAKILPPLLLLDLLLYLALFRKERQRASDRLAETIVIDISRPVWSPAPSAGSPSRPPQQFIPVQEPATGPTQAPQHFIPVNEPVTASTPGPQQFIPLDEQPATSQQKL